MYHHHYLYPSFHECKVVVQEHQKVPKKTSRGDGECCRVETFEMVMGVVASIPSRDFGSCPRTRKKDDNKEREDRVLVEQDTFDVHRQSRPYENGENGAKNDCQQHEHGLEVLNRLTTRHEMIVEFLGCHVFSTM